jgi:hypothetical protein
MPTAPRKITGIVHKRKPRESRRSAEHYHLYNNERWRKASRVFRAENPFCAMCEAPTQSVDHIQPHDGDYDRFWDESNWQALCNRCHGLKSRGSQAGEAVRVVVCGPPRAGKTTYVEARRGEGHIVWDQDEVAAAIIGTLTLTPVELSMLKAVRDGLCRWLATSRKVSAWVVVSDKRQAEDVAARIGAQVATVRATAELCIARIQADDRGRKGERIEAVRRWFRLYGEAGDGLR